jgi:uncharacterized membrane protein
MAVRWLLTLVMVGMGAMHFVDPVSFTRAMPPWVPWHLAMVYISGVFEILGGLGLVPERTRSAAGLGLMALYVAIFPANVHMALNNISFGADPVPTWALWVRLPMQLVLIGLAYWVSRPED